MNDMFGVIDIFVLVAAIYAGYQWFLLQFKGEIKTGILLNKDVNIRKCKDKDGYIKEASPMLLCLTICTLASSAVSLVNSLVTPLPTAVMLAALALFLVVIVWIGYKGKDLYKKYW